MKVTWYAKKIERIKTSKPKRRLKEILDLWSYLGEFPPNEQSRNHIKKNILSIYPDLDFEQKHAALQVLIRIHCGPDVRGLIFNYLGDVYQRFEVLANLMSSYLYILDGIDGSPRHDIGPWDLDKTFAATHKKLNK